MENIHSNRLVIESLREMLGKKEIYYFNHEAVVFHLFIAISK